MFLFMVNDKLLILGNWIKIRIYKNSIKIFENESRCDLDVKHLLNKNSVIQVYVTDICY